MNYLRLIKYPGAKTSILPEIEEVFNRSGCGMLVDVFGGSGMVSLNVNAPETVYNDTNEDLFDLFTSLKIAPEAVAEMLQSFIDIADDGRKRNDARAVNSFVQRKGEQVIRNLPSPLPGKKGTKCRKAVLTLFNYSTSFGGLGDTYGTRKEKSPFRYLLRTLEDLGEISGRVGKWTIENADFRDIVKKYDGEGTFFYLDPPYGQKSWYSSEFSENDYKALSRIMKSVKGRYLLNLDGRDDFAYSIFGEPTFSKSYTNRNGSQERGEKTFRRKIFYTNVRLTGTAKQKA